jgi:hypothetical protein
MGHHVFLTEWYLPFHVRFPDLGLVCWGGAALLQLALTALIYHRLRQRLEQRRFPVIDAGGKTC